MARKHSKSMKRRTHKGRKHRGGGWGFTGPSSIPGTPGTVSNPQVFTGIGDCRAVKPGYDIPYSSYAASMKGLPGMSGGKRTRKQRGKRTRKQRGGRYGFYPEGDVNPSGQAWWAGSYAPIQRIGCEGGSFNPLNPTHTGSSAPPGAANPNYWMKGGAQLAPATYGVGNVDSMYYYAPTAGYANTASTWKDSVGAPVQIQVPFAARAMNQACLTTGGHPPLTGALQKGGKRYRKHRGGNPITNALATATTALTSATSAVSGALGLPGASENQNPMIPTSLPNTTSTPEQLEQLLAPTGNTPQTPAINLGQPSGAPQEEEEEEELVEVTEAPAPGAPQGGRRRHKKHKKTHKKAHRKGRKTSRKH